MATDRIRRRAEPDPPPAPDVPEYYRSVIIPADQLGATLNRWWSEGFTEHEYELLRADEGASFGAPPVPRVFLFGWVADPDPEEQGA